MFNNDKYAKEKKNIIMQSFRINGFDWMKISVNFFISLSLTKEADSLKSQMY